MNQRKLDPEEEEKKKKAGKYEEEFEKTRHTFSGFTVSPIISHPTQHSSQSLTHVYSTTLNKRTPSTTAPKSAKPSITDS